MVLFAAASETSTGARCYCAIREKTSAFSFSTDVRRRLVGSSGPGCPNPEDDACTARIRISRNAVDEV